ncbi:MAG: hypothetical protein SGCHY_000324 [Lobulomycetales sp.]
MKFSLSIALLASLALVNAESDVVDLKKDGFEEFINAPLSLVSFTAPWCGHCKTLKPEFAKAASTLKADNIKLANVDCTVETDVCSGHGVQGYPTVKIFREGVSSDYKGARNADSIVETMKKQALPSLSELKSTDDVKKFSTAGKVVLIGYFESAESDDFSTFQKFANSFRDDYVSGYTIDAEAVKAMEAKTPQVILYKTFDELKNVLEGEITSASLEAFAKENSVPNMDELGPDNYGDYVKLGKPIVYLFTDNAEDKKKLGDIMEPLAKTYKKTLAFAYIDAVKYGGHGKTLNLKETWPGIVIQDTVKQAKYPLDQSVEYTEETLKTFISDYVDGKLEPSLKSEEPPADNEGPVKIVVGKNYESIVMDKSRDVFLELYAPWCGHCKKLSPVWDELGEFVKGSKIVIAKMDATENDLPLTAGYEVEGFPTLKLIKAETNDIVDYEGDRSMDSLIKFIKEYAVTMESVSADADKDATEEHDEL